MPAPEKSHAETPALPVSGAAVSRSGDFVRVFVRFDNACVTLQLTEHLAADLGRELLGAAVAARRAASLVRARRAQKQSPLPRRPRGVDVPKYQAIFAASAADPRLNVSALCRDHGVKPQRFFAWSFKRRIASPATPPAITS